MSEVRIAVVRWNMSRYVTLTIPRGVDEDETVELSVEEIDKLIADLQASKAELLSGV